MPLPDDQFPDGPGRPTKYDPVELAAIYSNGVDSGKTVGMIAQETAEFLMARAGLKRSRLTDHKIKRLAINLEKAMRRSRDDLFRPWKPEIGKGIHRYETTKRVTGFGELMFNGRPLTKPVGIEPRTPAKRGRRNKLKS